MQAEPRADNNDIQTDIDNTHIDNTRSIDNEIQGVLRNQRNQGMHDPVPNEP